jgi:hypothetical protein
MSALGNANLAVRAAEIASTTSIAEGRQGTSYLLAETEPKQRLLLAREHLSWVLVLFLLHGGRSPHKTSACLFEGGSIRFYTDRSVRPETQSIVLQPERSDFTNSLRQATSPQGANVQ